MKEDWKYLRLGEICKSIKDGDWIEKKDQSTAGIRLIQTGNIGIGIFKDKSDSAHFINLETFNRLHCEEVFEGDVLISRLPEPVGRACVIPNMDNRCITAVDCSIIKLDKAKIDTAFFLFYTQSKKYFNNVSSLCTGTTRQRISRKKLEEITIPVPPLPEQQRIVEYLDTQFAKIDALKANAAQQLQAAKDLFQSALKDLMTPKEGWEEKKLGELTSKIGSGATPKGGRKVYVNEGCSLIRSLNVLHGYFKYEDLAHITDEAAEQLKGVTIEENDVLFNITGASIARCCLVPQDVLPARVNQHVSILRINNKSINPVFLCYLLLSQKHQKELLTIGESGSTRQALTKNDLENHIVEFPSIETQNHIIETITHISNLIDDLTRNYEQTITLCSDLKQSLLKQIFE